MRTINLLQRLLVIGYWVLGIGHWSLVVGQSYIAPDFTTEPELSRAFQEELSDEPLPPDSVYAQMLGPDSAMYISWEAPPDSGLVLEGYDIYRLSDFDPEGDPASGVQTWFLSHNWPACDDPQWAGLSHGWYAYGVRAVYTNGMISEMAVSNIVGHNMFCSLNLTVSLETGDPASLIHAQLYGEDYSYEKYFGKDSANIHFDSVLKGHYLVGAYHTGFDTGYLPGLLINYDTTINLLLGQRKRPVYDLEVDSVSLIANWSPPALLALYEDFESEPFPPPGWQVLTPDEYDGWYRSLNGSTSEFTIPPHDGYYAVCTGMYGTGPHNGCCDYLVTPPLDLTEGEDYMLEFDSFYDGSFGQLAFVEYSFDRGETWEVMYQLMPSSTWGLRQIYLDAFSGQDANNPVWIAFHADDAGEWASGWAVDKVKIHVPSSTVEFTDFNVFLDDSLVTNTTNTTWNYAPLNYGQQYTASVSVNYPYGTSKRDDYSFTSRYLPPPNNLSASDEGSEVILQWEPPVEGTYRFEGDLLLLPENILGYKIYRNNQFLDYQEHSGGYEPQVYIDSGVEPGLYQYNVSGVYDLTIYGFPSDTGESMRSGDAVVTVEYCTDLAFTETWDSASFTQNNWLINSSWWNIDEVNGNPAPSAAFTPVYATSVYATLMSYPFCGTSITEGEIWLDYDLSLISIQPGGEENLWLELWDWDSHSWTMIKIYSNSDGSIPWTREHVNITNQSLGKVFRIRFIVTGSNPANIKSWFVDNISIYRVCNGPTNLTSAVNPDQAAIVLNWNAPETFQIDDWIHWDDGIISYYSVGTGDAAEFDVAARWEPSHLGDLEGASVQEVAFVPSETNCTYSIRIWTGNGADSLIVDQLVSNPVINQWNPIEINDPVLINTSKELWVGYHVNTITGYPAGCDNGPAIDGYGNMLNFGGWQTLLQVNPDLDYNWNIKAHVITLEGEKVSLEKGSKAESDNGNRDLSGYDIYRRTEPGEYSLIGFTTDTTYTDDDLANEMYCYMVSALWEGEFDQCESVWLGEVCEIMNVGISNTEILLNSFTLYPNPANESVHIISSKQLKQISVYNTNGQLIMGEVIVGFNHLLITSTFPSGLYLVKIKTTAGEITRLLSIQK